MTPEVHSINFQQPAADLAILPVYNQSSIKTGSEVVPPYYQGKQLPRSSWDGMFVACNILPTLTPACTYSQASQLLVSIGSIRTVYCIIHMIVYYYASGHVSKLQLSVKSAQLYVCSQLARQRRGGGKRGGGYYTIPPVSVSTVPH